MEPETTGVPIVDMTRLTFVQLQAMDVVPQREANPAAWAAGAQRLAGRFTFDLTDREGFDRRCWDVVMIGRAAIREAEMVLGVLGCAPWAPAAPAGPGPLDGWAQIQGETTGEALLRMAETPSDFTLEIVRRVGWVGVDALLEEHRADPRAAVERLARRRRAGGQTAESQPTNERKEP